VSVWDLSRNLKAKEHGLTKKKADEISPPEQKGAQKKHKSTRHRKVQNEEQAISHQQQPLKLYLQPLEVLPCTSCYLADCLVHSIIHHSFIHSFIRVFFVP
jgi:hypothetical protein